MTTAGREMLEKLKRTFTNHPATLHKDLLELDPDDPFLERKIERRLRLRGKGARPTAQTVEDIAQMVRDGAFGAPYAEDE